MRMNEDAMAWLHTLRELAHARGTDMANAENPAKHSHTAAELTAMLNGERAATQEGMMAILDCVAPIHGPHMMADMALRKEAMPYILHFKPAVIPVDTAPKHRRAHAATKPPVEKKPAAAPKVSDAVRRKVAAREQAEAWSSEPLQESDSFATGFVHCLAVSGRSRQKIADSIGLTASAVDSYAHGTLPRNIAPIVDVLRTDGVPEPMLEKLQTLHGQEKHTLKPGPRVMSPVSDHGFAHMRTKGDFSMLLSTTISALGMTPTAFDKHAHKQFGVTMQTALWCRPGAKMPEDIMPLVATLNRCGAKQHDIASLVQYHYAAVGAETQRVRA